MTRREFIRQAATAALGVAGGIRATAAEAVVSLTKGATTMADPRPNVLLLFTDQQRGDMIGAGGNELLRTPALDRLCEQGVRFERAYTPSPVCVPARYSLLTGLYPHRSGCADNGEPMDPTRPTLPGLLTQAGYQTRAIGKMHFSPVRQPFGFERMELSEEIPARPEDDEFLRDLLAAGFGHVHEPHGVRSEMYYLPQVSQLPAERHTTAWTGERTVQFLRQRDRSRPFFVWTSFIKPHPPFDPPVPWNKLYRDHEMPLPHRPEGAAELITWQMRHQNHYKRRDAGRDDNLIRAMRAAYYACVSFIDYQVGRILEELEKQGERENTLIVFTSDHGELLGDYDCYGKRCFYDPAARIPLIASWPGHLPAGTVCSTPVSLVDLLPTMVEAVGAEVPPLAKGGPGGVDGVSLLRTVAGENDRPYVLGQLNRQGLGVYHLFDGRYKYIYSAPDRREYLMDLETDPQETRNHADDQPATLKRLRTILLDRFRQDGYTEPLDEATGGWKTFPPAPAIPGPPSASRQDACWTDPYLREKGYQR